MSTILVTGGTGFIGSHAILRLLADGHRVRTSVRRLDKADRLRKTLAMAGSEPGDRLSFVEANLESDAGWAEAVAGCEHVLHVASPFPIDKPQHEDDLIVPAREGTLRVLRAARDAGVRRVVVTSSFAAIGYGHPPRATPFTEADWTVVEGADTQAYMKSKTLAERAAWDFMAREGGGLELSVVNPVGVFGPVLGPDLSSSVRIVQAMLKGEIPVCPRIYFGAVDVRDVVDLHVRAMTDPAAAGERFLAVAGETVSMIDVARILQAQFPREAGKVPRREIPDWLLRMLAIFVPRARQALPHLGIIRQASNEKARRMLGWQPRSNAEAIAATAESLIGLGLVG